MIARRKLITGTGAALILSLATPMIAQAAGTQRTLKMTNAHTGEQFHRTIHDGKNFSRDALDEFNWFARDWRQRADHSMDHRMLTFAADLQQKIGGRTMTMYSGYRSPKTNRSLPGTAKRSLHMSGKAVDIHVDGVSTSTLYRTAWGMQRGGVGKYTKSAFVHIDSGNIRTWGS